MTASVTADIRAGLAARHQGQADVIAADVAAHRGYAGLVVEAVESLGDGGYTFTAEDCRDWIKGYRPGAQPHHPNVMGAVLGSLVNAGRITAVGHVRCTRTSRRAGWMRAYRLTTPASPTGADALPVDSG